MRLLILLVLWLGCESTPRSPGVAEVININQATVKELEALPGIGDARARSIVAARNARGGRFDSLDEIVAIDGIGPATLERIRPLIVLGPPHPKPAPRR